MILAMATAPLPLIELRTLHCCTRQSIFSPQPPQECITPCTPLLLLPALYPMYSFVPNPPENSHTFVQIHARGWFPFPHSSGRLVAAAVRSSQNAKCMHLLPAATAELCSRCGTRVHVIAYTLYVRQLLRGCVLCALCQVRKFAFRHSCGDCRHSCFKE